MNRESRVVVFVAFFAGRRWKVKVLEVQYANPSIQASNQIESPYNPDRREESEYLCMQVNSLRHVSSANGLFLEEEKEEKAEE